jgi:hypothetical protein
MMKIWSLLPTAGEVLCIVYFFLSTWYLVTGYKLEKKLFGQFIHVKR